MAQMTTNTPQEVPGVELGNAIHQMFTTQDDNERKELMDKFEVLERAPEAHIRNVLTLLTKGEDTEEGQLLSQCKMSMVVYLKNFSATLQKNFVKVGRVKVQGPEQLQAKQQTFQTSSQIASLFIQAMLSPTLNLKYKGSFKHVIHKFMGICQMLDMSENHQDFNKVLEDFIKLVLQGLSQVNHFEIVTGAIHMIEVAFALTNIMSFEQVFESLIQPLRNVAEMHVGQFKADMLQVQQQMPLDQILSADNPIAVRILNSLEVLHSWAETFGRIFEKYEESNLTALNYFARSEAIMSVFAAFLGLTANQASATNQQQSLISFSGLQKLDQTLNKIKTKTLEAIHILAEYIFDHKKASEAQMCPLVPKTKSLAPALIQSLILFATDPNLEKLVENEEYSDLVIELIDVISIFCAEMTYYEIFEQKKVELIVSVALNLMQTMTEEAQQIIDEPQEFVNLALDCTDKQQSKIIKTQGCKLLETMCDNIDGSTYVLTTFCCNALHLALNGGQAQMLTPEGLWKMDQDPFLQRTDPIIVAETCLVALTVVAYTLPKRNDLVPYFQEVLAVNISKILEKVKPTPEMQTDAMLAAKAVILRSRFSLLLGYYADMLFVKHDNPFKDTMNFLFTTIGMTEPIEKVIALQSVDTLNTVVTDSDLAPRLVPMLPDIVSILNLMTPYVKYPTYFEFLQEFVKFYSSVLMPHICDIFKSLVERIITEQQNAGASSAQVVIGKAWNVLRYVCENKKYMEQYYDTIEELLKPLFQFIVDPSKIHFEDDIVLVLKSLMNRKKAVSPTVWEIFQHLPKVLEKNKHQFSNLLDTINNYLILGRDDLGRSEQNLKVLVDMADVALFTDKPNKTINNSEGAILIQLLFQVMKGTEYLNPIFELILNRIVTRMQTAQEQVLKKHLLGVFMSAVFYNSSATLNYLEQNKMTSELIVEMFKVKKLFKHSYERKFFIIGLSEMLQCPVLPESLRPLFVQLLEELMDMIVQEQNAKTKAIKKATKAELKGNEEDSSDDDDDSDYDDDQLDDDNSQDAVDGGSKKIPNAVEEDLGFVNKEDDDDNNMEDEEIKEDQKDQKIDAGDTSDDEGEVFGSDPEDFDFAFDLVVTMDMLNSPFKKVNEHEVFCNALRSLSHRSPEDMNQIVSQLSEDRKKKIVDFFQSKTIDIQNKDGESQQVTRKIVKVRRNRAPAAPAKKLELPTQNQ